MAERVVVECPSCFSKLALADESKLGRQIRCSKCAEVFVAERSEEQVERRAPPKKSRDAAPKKGKGRKSGSGAQPPVLLIGAGILVVLLLVGVGYWMFGPASVPEDIAQRPVGGQVVPPTNVSAPAGALPIAEQPRNVGTITADPNNPASLKVVLETKSVFNGKVSLLIPKDFTVMSDAAREAKYPAAQRPALAFTNMAGTVNVAFSHTQTPMTAAQLPGAVSQLEGTSRKLVPASDWIRTETPTIAREKWFTFEFRSKAIDMTIRNLLAGTSLDNRLFLVTINVPEADEQFWMPVATTIVQSLRLNRAVGLQKPSDDLHELIGGGKPKDSTPLKPLPAAALGQGSATIKITNLSDADQGQLLADRIRRATQATSSQSSSFGNQLTLTINGVGDLKVLADALEIGEVTDINEASRTISIRANPSGASTPATSNTPASVSNERPFKIQISSKLKVVPLLSMSPDALACTKDGKIATDGGPTFFVAFQAKPISAEARKSFAEQRAAEKGDRFKQITIQSVKPIRLDGLEGFETLSEAEDATSGNKLLVTWVTLFDDAETFVMSGTVGSDERDEYLPEFQAMMQSFKKSSN